MWDAINIARKYTHFIYELIGEGTQIDDIVVGGYTSVGYLNIRNTDFQVGPIFLIKKTFF